MFLVDGFFLACKILTDWLDHLETGMKENPRVSHVFSVWMELNEPLKHIPVDI